MSTPTASLLPTLAELTARARADLRIGLPVAVGPWLAAALETLTPARLAALRGFGPAQIVLTGWRAETLKIAAYDGEVVRLALPGDADAAQLRALADPAQDLAHPLKGPWRPLREGDAEPARVAIALTKTAELLPALLMVAAEAPAGLTALPVAPLKAQLAAEAVMSRVSAASVPLVWAGRSRLHVFRPDDGGTEHYAIEVGDPPRDQPVLARLHSACFTGDVLGSLKCDCGPQLHAALEAMRDAGGGVLLYLNQEGRGIGLANKMRAYALQDQGFDTVDANHRLGFEDDERDFRIGAALLRQMGFDSVRLMTNNPRKLDMMRSHGIEVAERVPLVVPPNPYNSGYLATKARRSGHLL